MPDCSTCVAVYQTPCFYDIDSDHRRKAALKRDITTLEGRNSSLNIIFRSIRTSSESEVAEIVQQIRAEEGIDIDVLAESLEKNKLLSERSERYESPGRLERSGQSEQSETSGGKSAEGELSNLIGRPAHDLDGVGTSFRIVCSSTSTTFFGRKTCFSSICSRYYP